MAEMTMDHPFHLAFPVHDLKAARAFYGGVLGCDEGRSSDTWVDFNLYGIRSSPISAPTKRGSLMRTPLMVMMCQCHILA